MQKDHFLHLPNRTVLRGRLKRQIGPQDDQAIRSQRGPAGGEGPAAKGYKERELGELVLCAKRMYR
jgi:hypothetical protein